jgi:hypothetical protein
VVGLWSRIGGTCECKPQSGKYTVNTIVQIVVLSLSRPMQICRLDDRSPQSWICVSTDGRPERYIGPDEKTEMKDKGDDEEDSGLWD